MVIKHERATKPTVPEQGVGTITSWDGTRNARVIVLPGQQHIAMNTAPELFVREVLKFLQG